MFKNKHPYPINNNSDSDSDSDYDHVPVQPVLPVLPVHRARPAQPVKKKKTSIQIKTNDGTYEYDKWDIIDFLEPEYITDWLELIPDKCWNEFNKDVEKAFGKITDERVMDLVMSKIKINLPKYIVDNYEKINLESLKYCVKKNFEKLSAKIKYSDAKFNTIIKSTLQTHDLNFNKYFYEELYFKLEPTHKYDEFKNKSNYTLLPNNIYIHKNNKVYKICDTLGLSHNFKTLKYELIKYYDELFPNVFHNCNKNNIIVYMFMNTFCASKIDNYDDIIKLKNILNISDHIFSREILIGQKELYTCKHIFFEVCEKGNTELVFKLLNNHWNFLFETEKNIIEIMTQSALSKNYELVFLLYNFYTEQKNIEFTDKMCSQILRRIIGRIDKKSCDYDKIIYEFLNMGANISGYSKCSLYTDYVNSIKSIKHKNSFIKIK